jgi:hypothetical protein
MKRGFRVILAVVGAIVATIFSMPSPSAAPQSGPPASLTINGSRNSGGGCHFDIDVTLSPGQGPVQYDEVSEDMTKCTATFARAATVSSAQVAGESTAGSTATAGATASSVVAAAYVNSSGYHRIWFTDPPGKTVVSVLDNVRWDWNGSNVQNAVCNNVRSWYDTSGWRETASDLNCTYNSN